MIRKFFAVLLLLVVSIQYSALRADEVVLLQPVAGSASEYSVAQLLRVELIGDSIRFIGADDNRPYKIIENDHVVIIRNSEKYDVTGKKL